MKNNYLFLLVLVLVTALPTHNSAQVVSNNNEWGVYQVSKNAPQCRDGELIVKFRDSGAVKMNAPKRTKFAAVANNGKAANAGNTSTGVRALDELLLTLGVDSVEELMPLSGSKPLPRKIRTHNGTDIEPKAMGRVYRLKLSAEKQSNLFHAIDTLKQLPDVEFAEPNYVMYIQSADSATYVQEPLYSQQWGLQAINMPQLWNKPKITTKRPIIAILDTGVDTEHPDLAVNIWTNEREADGLSNQDDDNNGFVDDLHGYDFINQTGTIHDFNGHGTHCAGIAAAVGNNGIGITGANPDALIMPITIMQSDGTSDVATIIRGIDYAVANGADILSMSFGSYSYSIALEQSLARAYTSAVLVAAAGNDGLWIDKKGFTCYENVKKDIAVLYPAAFTFVLGVEASNQNGCDAVFSNVDSNPIYSTFGEEQLYNYELRAPGQGIYSTFPNGRYKTMSGTSMACPLVAGAVSRLLQCKEYDSKEILFGDLIHTRKNGMYRDIDIKAAYDLQDSDRKPTLWLVGYNLTDSVGGDGDGRPDAGETMEIYPIFRNDWGQAENIRYWLKLGYYNDGDWVNDDASLITFLTDTVSFNRPLSSYAKSVSDNPLRFKISENCTDGRHINVTIFAVCDNMTDTLKQTVRLEVENGVEIGGMITQDMTLYPDVHYIVTKPLAVPLGVKLNILPGTVIKFKDGTGLAVQRTYTDISISGVDYYAYYHDIDTLTSGRLIAHGTPDSMIVFTGADHDNGEFYINLGTEACYYSKPGSNKIEYYQSPESTISYCIIEGSTFSSLTNSLVAYGDLNNCVVRYNVLRSAYCGLFNVCNLQKCNVFYNEAQKWHDALDMYNNVASNIQCDNKISRYDVDGCEEKGSKYASVFFRSNNLLPLSLKSIYDNDISSDEHVTIVLNTSTPKVVKTEYPSYYGSSKESIVRQSVWDIEHGYGMGYFDLSNMLTRPVREAHGIVWKVVINGYDAQDEFEQLPPLGVGTHKCEVYFNRPMDVAVMPTISYGVRPPYTQHAISDSGSWSADSTVYTAYFTIDGKTVSDGLNRLYVADARDDEHFEIPIENMRFNMQIAAAGSMSTGLMAEAGLGKVTLTWETDEEDFADLLGYNIYRFTDFRDSTYVEYDKNGTYNPHYEYIGDTAIINQTIIDSDEQTYTDFDVVPGTTYYYVIKQLTTSLNTYTLSNAVAATPLTAQKGDANGSMSVNVADVLTEVAYIMHEDPQPFIFEAADVNNDNVVNIFDVVGTVNLILNPQSSTQAINTLPAYYIIEDGILYVETDVVLGGVQFSFAAQEGSTFEALEALEGFERIGQWQTENEYIFMAYSMSGKSLGMGKHALLRITGEAEITSIALSDQRGAEIAALPKVTTAVTTTETIQMHKVYPNPFADRLTIDYTIGESGHTSAYFAITDLAGRTVQTAPTAAAYGAHSTTLDLKNLQHGIYFVNLYVDGMLIQTDKVVKE